MAYRRYLVMLVGLAIVGFAKPSRAETCLDHFSCHLHGECRLPCFGDDAATGEAPPPPAAATAVSDPRPSSVADPTAPKPTIVVHKPKPWHPAIVRVVASKAIRTLSDLAGKPVSFGLNGDRFQALGRRAFVLAGIKVQEIPLDLGNALDGVSTGDIAAVVVIGDGNARRLARLGATDLHLLTIPAPDEKRKLVASRHRPVAENAARPVLASAR